MGLRDIGATLPPGFRFYPSDEELVCHYLFNKISDHQKLIHKATNSTLVDIDLHTCEPWQLPEMAKLNSTEWYFFNFRDRKYATGYRSNRATASGYWKATGKDRTVVDGRTRTIVGMRKTLVFYKNRAPNGIKTGWIMHEFRLENPHIPPKEDWVLCRVFYKAKSLENNDTISHENTFETTPNFSQHQNQKIFTTNNQQNQNPNNFLDIPTLNPNFLTQNRVPTTKLCENKMPNVDNDYGFLYDDMGFDESELCSLVPPTLDEMRFEDDILSE